MLGKTLFRKSLCFLPLTALAMLIGACSEDRLPLPPRTHTEAWSNPQSADFHGAKVVEVGYGSCQSCHGADHRGGESRVSCYGCHENYPHAQHWLVKRELDFHGNDIRGRRWSMDHCKTCHGNDYLGGRSRSSCFKCHTDAKGPESCNVCHGNVQHSHPPEDLSGNTETTALGVGAHEKHMKRYQCRICHVVPDSFSAPTHIDAPPAEVLDAWQWNRTVGSCAGSCHGGRLIWNRF